MLDRAEVHKIVLEQGWLSLTPPSFQHSVLERCRLRHYKRGESIYSAGDTSSDMFGLIVGALAISVAPGERGPYVAHFARPGSWYGEAASITGQPRRVGLLATRATGLLKLPAHAIREIVGKDPSIWRLFALATVTHLDLAMGACDDLMIRDPVRRCVAILLRLGGRRQMSPAELSPADLSPAELSPADLSPADLSPIEIDLSQADIADLANVARTTLNTILRELEKAGKIERSYRRIRILSPKALRAMLRG